MGIHIGKLPYSNELFYGHTTHYDTKPITKASVTASDNLDQTGCKCMKKLQVAIYNDPLKGKSMHSHVVAFHKALL